MGCVHIIPVQKRKVNVTQLLRGVPGKDGADGDGAARFRFVQSSPLDTWIVNHNFGYLPVSVSVRSPGGVEVDAQITHASLNQVIINFAAPYAGTVDLM